MFVYFFDRNTLQMSWTCHLLWTGLTGNLLTDISLGTTISGTLMTENSLWATISGNPILYVDHSTDCDKMPAIAYIRWCRPRFTEAIRFSQWPRNVNHEDGYRLSKVWLLFNSPILHINHLASSHWTAPTFTPTYSQ